MNTTNTRELNTQELDLATGGDNHLPTGMVYCGEEGVKVAGGCTPTFGDMINLIDSIVQRGRQIQQQHGGGRPS